MSKEAVTVGFQESLEAAAKRLGISSALELSGVATYAAERMQHLSTLVGDPGYEQALAAEVDAVALRAGIAAVDAGDAADRELFGVIFGSIAMGTRLLV